MSLWSSSDHAPVVMPSRTWCQIESDILPIPGHTLTQTIPIAVAPEIHKELLDFWKQRWQVLSSVPEADWTRIANFVRAYVPRITLQHASLDVDLLRSAFKSSRSLKTGGPDGWRRLDVKSLPDDILHDAVNMFAAIEGGIPWPDQLTRGHVFCLQKKPNLHDVGNFRPVVLFSLWARLWSNLRARHYLCQLEKHACFAAFGFLPGRSCMDLTFSLQCTIEAALRSGSSLCGALFDIEKCFNNIPRKPILFLAEWFGIDSGVICAWSAFLRQIHRAFLVHQIPSESVLSDTGLPEGDSMSCLGMLLLTFSYHVYMEHFQPSLTSMSYVDNLELLSASTGELLAGVVTLEAWAQMFGLRLDSKKSAYWALAASDRRSLTALGLHVTKGDLDLGATMIYGARHRNAQSSHFGHAFVLSDSHVGANSWSFARLFCLVPCMARKSHSWGFMVHQTPVSGHACFEV